MKGIGASPGIAIGKALVLERQEVRPTGIVLADAAEIEHEIERFTQAVATAVAEVEVLKETLADDETARDVLEIQVELLQDEQIRTDVVDKITAERKSAVDAVLEVIAAAADIFRNMEDEYFSARAADVQDAGNRIARHLTTGAVATLVLPENTIIVAEDIAPSDMLSLDLTRVGGFATRVGGKTSHAAIVAKVKGIPAAVGCGTTLATIQTGDVVIIDGTAGEVIANPTDTELKDYTIRQTAFRQQATLLAALKDTEATTTDGVTVKLMANIANAADMDEALAFGAEGSGLLRTELLFMGRTSLPSENEQFEFYKNVALKARGRSVVVRTLDIGGDKHLPYFNLPPEQNPFLGYRAIRICLDRPDLFFTQLRAILRASVFGDLKIMFPMISNVQEIEQAKAFLEEAKTQLAAKGVAFNRDIETGIMIEIPSAAVMADILAKRVSFFSIGTNDLCQYTLAVDRMNEHVKHLYDPFNPGVLRLIRQVIEQGNKHHGHTAMCGELAGDPTATLLLLGMGLREFSMSASSIPYVKNIIIQHSFEEARKICEDVMALEYSKEIAAYLEKAGREA